MAYDYKLLAARVILEVDSDPSVRLTTIASRLGVGRHTLTRALQHSGGTTFRELSSASRLRRIATRLCAAPESTIKEVAYALGYERPGSLARFVRSQRGQTPTQLRAGVNGSLVVSGSRGGQD